MINNPMISPYHTTFKILIKINNKIFNIINKQINNMINKYKEIITHMHFPWLLSIKMALCIV